MSSLGRPPGVDPGVNLRRFSPGSMGYLVRYGRRIIPGDSLAVCLLNGNSLLMSPRLSRLCAVWYIVLIAVPFTAPSQTIDLADFLSGHSGHHGVQFAATPVLASLLADTDLSLVPALETTAARLKLDSRLVPNGSNFATASCLPAAATAIFAQPSSSAAALARHLALPTILRR
jgi:hypothetical protein